MQKNCKQCVWIPRVRPEAPAPASASGSRAGVSSPPAGGPEGRRGFPGRRPPRGQAGARRRRFCAGSPSPGPTAPPRPRGERWTGPAAAHPTADLTCAPRDRPGRQRPAGSGDGHIPRGARGGWKLTHRGLVIYLVHRPEEVQAPGRCQLPLVRAVCAQRVQDLAQQVHLPRRRSLCSCFK